MNVALGSERERERSVGQRKALEYTHLVGFSLSLSNTTQLMRDTMF